MLLAAPAFGQDEPYEQVIYYRYVLGTGFIINDEGDIITNAHVVRDCQSISILTPQGEESAVLLATDTKRDLAVLKTAFISRNIAPLRLNIRDIRVGDDVVVMGYPGTNADYERYQFKKSRVLNLQGPPGREEWLQLMSVSNRGNSGGPVLDMSGNVIAVVSGMALTFKVGSDGQLSDKAVNQADVAVPLVALQGFLQENNIEFYEAISTSHVRGDNALRTKAHSFIFPVRCTQTVTPASN